MDERGYFIEGYDMKLRWYTPSSYSGSSYSASSFYTGLSYQSQYGRQLGYKSGSSWVPISTPLYPASNITYKASSYRASSYTQEDVNYSYFQYKAGSAQTTTVTALVAI